MNIRLSLPLLGSLLTCAAVACTTTVESTSPHDDRPTSSSSSSSSGSVDPVDDETPGPSSSSSGGSSSGGSSSGGSSSGGSSSGGTSKPTSLKITAKMGSVKPTHLLSSDETKIISAMSIGGAPSFSPSKPSELPNVPKAKSFEVTSPSPGACKPNMSFTLNGSQVAVIITATDPLPETACAKWTDAIASSGLEVSLQDVPYPNGGTADVDIDFAR